LSEKYAIDVAELAEINGISENTSLRRGQTLLVPRGKSRARESTYHLAQNNPNSQRNAYASMNNQIVYVVQKGDTLFHIAKRYGINVKEIKLWNGNNERLSIGQKLTLRLANSNRARSPESS
jgi:membrane-bound lytic murein transglycosylase D